MSIDETIAELLRAERRRTATILRDVDEWARKYAQTWDASELLALAAKHIEHGDENGTLFVECPRCRDYKGNRRRTELPFGYDSFGCEECGLDIKWSP